VVSASAWQSFTYTIANPDISVTEEVGGYTYVVDDGMGWISYGDTIAGAPIDKTFTITNDGLETLTLDVGSLTVPDGFSVQTAFASSVAPGQSTALVIRLDAVLEASFSGDVSFATSDGDENPFDFHIEGDVVPPAPEISVTTEDAWGDPYAISSGSEWVYFDDTTVGSPQTKTFTIENTGTADLNLDSSSLSVPEGFTAVTVFTSTVAPSGSTALAIQLDAAADGYYSGTMTFATNDDDENPFQFYVAGDVTTPAAEIAVSYQDQYGDDCDVADGYDVVDFDTATVGVPVDLEFTIDNSGDDTLTLDPNSLSLPAGFSVAAPFASTVAGVR